MSPATRLSLAAIALWALQLVILSAELAPIAVAGFALMMAALLPKQLRLIPLLAALGLAGWLLPTNQTSLPAFEVPEDKEQVFQVESNAQSWGSQQRYWISLSQQDDRIGYLVVPGETRLQVGASYIANLHLQPSSDLERAGFFGRLRGEYSLLTEPDSWRRQISELRDNFALRISGPTPDSVALVLGLTVGDRSRLSDELTLAMRDLSLSHIVAVSGANLAIAMGAVFFLASALGISRGKRYAAASAAALCYAVVVGPEPSVLRAVFMAHVILLCLALGRKSATLVAVSWAALILLAVDPFLAIDFGFALSIAATTGILTLARPLQRILQAKLPRVLALGIAVSMSAQLFTMPILLMLQPGIPSYSILANLLAMPLLTPITLLGLLAFALQSLPSTTEYLTMLAAWPAWLIEQLAHMLIDLPFTRLAWPGGQLGVAIATLIVIKVAASLHLTRRRGALAVAAAVLAATSSIFASMESRAASFPSDWSVIACDVGQGDAMLIRSEGSVALIDVGPRPQALGACLDQAGISRVNLLVLSHFDMDHVGGLQAIVDCCEIERVLIPDFEDGREIASIVERQLTAKSELEIYRAAAGLSGQLGRAKWTVLSPGAIEKSGSDSNAASIAIYFATEDLRLISLGDVPAGVQDRIAHNHAGMLMANLHLPSIIKVSHHGAADQSLSFMKTFAPDFAVFSTGHGNSYGHPTEIALDLAREAGAKIVRTDQSGSAVFVESQGTLTLD